MTDQQKINAIIKYLGVDLDKSKIKTGNMNKMTTNRFMKGRYSILKKERRYVFFSPSVNTFYTIDIDYFNKYKIKRDYIRHK